MNNEGSKIWEVLGEALGSLVLAIFVPGFLWLSASFLVALSEKVQEFLDFDNPGIHTFATYFIIWAIIWMWFHKRNKAKD